MLQKIKNLDDLIVDKIAYLHTPSVIKIMRFVSALGTQGRIWFALCIPLLISEKLRITGCNLLIALGITCLTGEGIIKHIVCRVRPCNKMDDDKLAVKKRPAYYSFPSGHTASSFSVAAVIFIRLPILFVPVFIFAVIMSFSRLYLQVHYLTDVIAGSVLGVLCGILSYQIFLSFNEPISHFLL